jgi:drug/metabolite transporter (DMT)-like permease
VRASLSVALLFAAACALLALGGDYGCKRWQVGSGRQLAALLVGVACYEVNTLLWVLSLRAGGQLTELAVVFSLVSLLGGVAMGLAFGERLDWLGWLGVVLAIAAVVLVALGTITGAAHGG